MSNSLSPQPESTSSDRSSQRAGGLLILVVLSLIGLRWYTDCSQPRPAELKREAHQVELNRADRSELLQLPGIGPTRVDKILAYRTSKGSFTSVDELRSVDGIGDITMQRLKPLIRVELPAENGDEPVRLTRKPAQVSKTSANKKPALESPIDINRASVAELKQLPNIGDVIAQRIVDERARKPFTKIEDLRRVGGIGAKRLEQLRPLVTVGE